MKITVIGAGNVGATCANVLAHKNFAKEIVLVDIKEGLAEGKALDIWQTSPVNMYDTRVTGVTGDYSPTKGSDVIIITSGLPRKPGSLSHDPPRTTRSHSGRSGEALPSVGAPAYVSV